MPSLVAKTTPDYTTLISPKIVATGNIELASTTLDLRNVPGAWVVGFMGRGSNGTPTRAGYFMIRPTDNNSDIVPTTIFDMVGQGPTTAALLGNLTADVSTSANTIAIASTSFAIGDTVCIFNSSGTLIQWNRIASGATTSWTMERNHRVANLSGNSVSNLADVRRLWIPGGDIYECRFVNYSSISYAVQLLAIVDKGETIT
jgi:hypothetical protein